MKNGKIGLILTLFLSLLTGCGQKADDVKIVDAVITDSKETIDEAAEATRTAFSAAIERLEQEGVYPDGSTSFETASTAYQDQYAVCDVDGDGKEELLLQHTEDCMAGMFIAIYGFDPDTESLREELVEWPSVQIYDNGCIRAEASHNQTCGNLWPYGLWQYDGKRDEYVLKYRVHSLDKSLCASENEEACEVYFVNEASDDDWKEENPMREEDYLAWENTWQDGAKELQPEWKTISVPGVDLSEAIG